MILKNQKFSHPRFVKENSLHLQLSLDHIHMELMLKRIRRMIVESQFEIPTIDDAMIEKVRKDFGIICKKKLSFTSIMDKAKKKWKNTSTSS